MHRSRSPHAPEFHLASDAVAARRMTAAEQPLIHWIENDQECSAHWRSESGNPAPKRVVIADDRMTADSAYRLACEGTGMLWRGDFQNARQLLQALARRAEPKPKKRPKLPATPAVVDAGKPLTAKLLACGVAGQSLALSSTVTVLSKELATARSGKPSRLKSPTATAVGPPPTGTKGAESNVLLKADPHRAKKSANNRWGTLRSKLLRGVTEHISLRWGDCVFGPWARSGTAVVRSIF